VCVHVHTHGHILLHSYAADISMYSLCSTYMSGNIMLQTTFRGSMGTISSSSCIVVILTDLNGNNNKTYVIITATWSSCFAVWCVYECLPTETYGNKIDMKRWHWMLQQNCLIEVSKHESKTGKWVTEDLVLFQHLMSSMYLECSLSVVDFHYAA
jgi:hypothetical protein